MVSLIKFTEVFSQAHDVAEGAGNAFEQRERCSSEFFKVDGDFADAHTGALSPYYKFGREEVEFKFTL